MKIVKERNDNEVINIIGTIGADLIEKKITMIDFKNDVLSCV